VDRELDFEQCYRAAASRDARFDGWFVTCVTSTKIYCRPSCPAITPKRANVRFLPSAAAAQRDGFRACLRCRPDAAPGSPQWNYRSDVVGRAMRLIADGVVDRDGVVGLAARIGYTERHLNRILTAEVGAGPLALARAQRSQTARLLIETTTMGLAEIAFAAGFGSVRQFNDTIRETYGRSPSELRAARRNGAATPGHELGTMTLRLPYREPLHAESLLEFLGGRTIAGVDEVRDDRYRRALRLPHGHATVDIAIRPGYAEALLRLADVRDLAPAVARCRRLLDLDADPVAVDAVLARDPALAASVSKEPGVRVPGAVDGFEIAVRAVVGQQISVAGARTVLARLAAATASPALFSAATSPPATASPADDRVQDPRDHELQRMITASGRRLNHDHADLGSGKATPGAPRSVEPGTEDLGNGLRGFPTAEEVAAAPDSAVGMPAARRRTLRALAEAVVEGRLRLDPGADRMEAEARLVEIPGIGPWTAQYVALRALGDPDVLLPTDLGVRRGAAALGLPDDPVTLARHAHETWAPWRSYATIRLWRHA
jgi:AraC family transcriptional regulator of adaptative response / DNA-3-methyladenine glycosylase II